MKTLRYMAAALAAAGLMMAPANATTTFIFKGFGGTPDTPVGPSDSSCGSTPDICNVLVDGVWQSLDYSKDGVSFSVDGYASGTATRLIQDIFPSNSGLGVWSELGDPSADQTQANAGEAIEFTFDNLVQVTDIEFNAGGDTNCSSPSEGECGEFQLQVFDLSGVEILNTVYDITGVDMLAQLGVAGKRFLITALTPDAGFTIGQFKVSEVPVPAALPLLLSGLAGLGFASRRRKSA